MRQTTVDMGALARTIALELEQLEPGRQVEFVVAPGLVVYADARLVRSLLQNLLGNAWKFTGKHPTARIELGRTEQDGETVYFVRDDGAGFDGTYAQGLFGAFNRLHHPSELEGTGMVWRSCTASFSATAAGFGRRLRWKRGQRFSLRCP